MYALHIGAPKTGTTSLQHALAELKSDLEPQGVDFRPTAAFQKGPVGQYIRGKSELSPADLDALRRDLARNGTVLISDEGCSGPLMNPSKMPWSQAAERAFRFTETIGAMPSRVIVTIRRQDDFLLSCYMHRLRHGRVDSAFDDYWRREMDLEVMSWSSFLASVEAVYGRDRLVVLPYEALKQDFAEFVRAFLELGVGATCAKDRVPLEFRNSGFDEAQVENALSIVRFMKGKVRSVKEIKERIKARLVAPKAERPVAQFKPDLADLRARLADRFRADNQMVHDRYLNVKHPGFLFA